jgi:hypothetical protein
VVVHHVKVHQVATRRFNGSDFFTKREKSADKMLGARRKTGVELMEKTFFEM